MQSDQIMLDSVLEDKCSLKFQAKEKLLITSSSSSSSTETIKADDQVLMLDQGVLVDNLCAVLQLKKSVEIDERDVIQQVHINQQKGPLKSILINSSPTQITENDALDNKSVMTEDNEIQQDELNLNCTNDEEILETVSFAFKKLCLRDFAFKKKIVGQREAFQSNKTICRYKVQLKFNGIITISLFAFHSTQNTN